MKRRALLFFEICLSLAVLSQTACETKREARLQAQEAYVAGQQQALQQTQGKPPFVTVNGPVRNPVIPWTEDLTLAKAIVAADYTGYLRPRLVRVTRQGETTSVKTSDLLNGQDQPLQPGDIVEVVP
jgi:hypothetical protein